MDSAVISRISPLTFHRLDGGNLPVSIQIARFQASNGVDEYHLAARPTEYADMDTQLGWLFRAYRDALDAFGLDMGTALLRRFFCTDLPNQAAALASRPFSDPRDRDALCAVSWVGQPPVPPAKVALWAYHVRDPQSELEKSKEGASLTLKRGTLSHHWTTGVTEAASETSHEQTRRIFARYEAFLRTRNLTLADNVIRTWFFVRNIDANYQGMVVARRELFAERGLSADTHFIASTGIEGASADVAAKVCMDAYAISGVRPDQIDYLEAPDHLGPTADYGVTFERATAVTYRDRKHVFISGTASIDPRGNILFPGDVLRQFDRALDNVEALLGRAGATLEDMASIIVYVRDPGDHALLWRELGERFGDAPVVIVVAPVCRPGWLVEIEGLAIVPAFEPEMPSF